MADLSHLEKMGRELRCPICLSLLNSAASISCNHVFCNECIVKSMKRKSNCPVCKDPFHRREIRPAPHMDNLVGIYKSMESATGVNMFMTEVENESKPAEPFEKLPEAGKYMQTDSQKMGRNQVRSSFPSKKRVQVAQYPLPETPTQPTKNGSLPSILAPEEPKNETVAEKSSPCERERSGTTFAPFFWLRDDEDARSLSQQSYGTPEMDLSPPPAVSFSDLKDSDNETPYKNNTQDKMCGSYPAVDLFDNEMFPWTQRCLPELDSSPKKLKALDNDHVSAIQEQDLGADSQVRDTFELLTSPGAEHLVNEQESCPKMASQLCSAETIRSKNNKELVQRQRARNTRITTKRTAVKRLEVNRSLETHTQMEKQSDSASDSEEKAIKWRKNDAKLDTAAQIALRTLPAAPTEEPVQQVAKNIDKRLTNQIEKGDKNSGIKTCNSATWIKSCQGLKCCSKSRKQWSAPSKVGKLKDLSEIKDKESKQKSGPIKSASQDKFSEVEKKECKNISPQIPMGNSYSLRSQKRRLTRIRLLNKHAEDRTKSDVNNPQNLPGDDSKREPLKENLSVDNSPRICHGAAVDCPLASEKNTRKKSSNKEMGISSKKIKLSFVGISSNDSISSELDLKEMHTAKNAVDTFAVKVRENSSAKEISHFMVEGATLLKCGNPPGTVQCVFCQSSEDSKPHGDMVHYFDGKPVVANHSGDINVIPCHKICAEWAPNVYFKDECVVNLKDELARSRRTPCSCCGVKGAALGCYQKNCRRSFHVPCAMLMPQCRWDTENFVMLCPLHASSKLPSEMSRKSKKRKMTCDTESLQDKLASVDTPRVNWKRDSRVPHDKVLMCCSALADSDKVIVSQFKTLSGVRESRKWSPNITHVIASTDENGACRRTLKILMAILEGKWILNVQWLKACMDAKQLVDEQQYEISVDIHGIRDGPRLGRLRVLNKEPKLLDRLEFYFCGEFAPSYKGYLQDLITAAGGTILHRKPICVDQSRPSTFIIYNLELPEKCNPSDKDALLDKRISEAKRLASSTGAKAESNTWILDSIAACQLQNGDE